MTETALDRTGSFLVLVAIIGLCVAVSTRSRELALALSSVMLFVATLGMLIRYRARTHKAEVDAILSRLAAAAPAGYRVTPIANEGDLWDLWKINCDHYGAQRAMKFEKYLGWWRRYPSGIFGLFHGTDLVGGLSIWPLRRKAFENAVKQGRSFSVHSLHSERDAAHCAHWFVSGIVVKPEFRSRHAVQYLFREAMRHSLTTCRSLLRVNLCAAASSLQGERLLRRFCFDELPSKSGSRPASAYVLLNADSERLRRMANRIAAAKV